MEMVDLYDENRIPLGRTVERYGGKTAPGDYRIVVHVCLFDHRGRLLIQQRASDKAIWPDRWDISVAGGVSAGEDSRTAAEREFREELGVPLDLTGKRASLTVNYAGGFDDFYIVVRDIPEEALTLQKEEVQAARWATLEEAEAMTADGRFIPYPPGFLRFLYEMRDSCGFPIK